jgi:FKBP-type peptidyl-prolyl cis-trans isomerase (trigger factor)
VGLVLDAIARQEGLQIADDDLEGRIERIVADAPAELSMRLRTLYGDPAMREELRGRMLRERALEWVRERAVVRDATPESVVAESGGTR